jgi:CDGSH-type Zn-finger protein
LAIKIIVRDNGPLLVEGDDVTVHDPTGAEHPLSRRPFALCRCGHSEKKPFCDGAHNAAGFQAAERASG